MTIMENILLQIYLHIIKQHRDGIYKKKIFNINLFIFYIFYSLYKRISRANKCIRVLTDNLYIFITSS